MMGVVLIAAWYKSYGNIPQKEIYNPSHPYIFAIPLIGWLMIRNSSRYLTECHSTFLEFLGRNTLETYVLQFHLFMNHSVQHIPIIIPGSGADGSNLLRLLNMMLCGSVFVAIAVQARKITVSTQTTVVEVVELMLKKVRGQPLVEMAEEDPDEEMKPMVIDTSVPE